MGGMRPTGLGIGSCLFEVVGEGRRPEAGVG